MVDSMTPPNLSHFTLTLIASVAFCACTSVFHLGCGDSLAPKTGSDCPKDSTSHILTWDFFLLADGGSSFFNDVAIINDTCVWAVGNIYLNDSTGNIDPSLYNVAIWNGATWSYKRFAFQDFGGNYLLAPIEAVLAFAPDNIWLGTGAALAQWNGQELVPRAFIGDTLPFTDQIYRLWGTSSTDIYFAGGNGAVYHYTGSVAQRLYTGTSNRIRDIWGKSVDGRLEIMAVASNLDFLPQNLSLLQIRGNSVTSLSTFGLPLSLSAIWFDQCSRFWLTGEGAFRAPSPSGSWSPDQNHPLIYMYGIRGLASNDLFVVGSFGLVSHFNGKSWQHYSEAQGVPRFDGSYFRVAVTGNLVCAVGLDGGTRRAVALLGRR